MFNSGKRRVLISVLTRNHNAHLVWCVPDRWLDDMQLFRARICTSIVSKYGLPTVRGNADIETCHLCFLVFKLREVVSDPRIEVLHSSGQAKYVLFPS